MCRADAHLTVRWNRRSTLLRFFCAFLAFNMGFFFSPGLKIQGAQAEGLRVRSARAQNSKAEVRPGRSAVVRDLRIRPVASVGVRRCARLL